MSASPPPGHSAARDAEPVLAVARRDRTAFVGQCADLAEGCDD